ncbi:MAG: RNA polymerase sigma factor [Polyangiaceae bacterium]|nr:RNA polymerase sigma factor [Polyangiaceae bacterium]
MGASEADALDLRAIHAAHGELVWLSLQRLGAPAAAVDDLFQEVFLVVHRQLPTFEGRSKITTWLFGICVRVVSSYRKRAHVRRETPLDDAELSDDGAASPEVQLDQEQMRAHLERVLDGMDPTRRATFVMFEIEGLSCDEIAEMSDVPVGTVYSRLHAARKDFVKSMNREAMRNVERWQP